MMGIIFSFLAASGNELPSVAAKIYATASLFRSKLKLMICCSLSVRGDKKKRAAQLQVLFLLVHPLNKNAHHYPSRLSARK